MAIYKLGEILKRKPEYGANLAAKKNGKYKYFRQTDFGKKPTTFVDKHKNKIMKRGDFFISRAGTINSYIHESKEKYVYAGYLVKYPIDSSKALSKYVYLWSQGIGKKQIISYSNTGSTMPKFNPPVALSLKIKLPNLEKQQKIIDIIEPIDKLIFKLQKINLYLFKVIFLYIQKLYRNAHLKYVLFKKILKLINGFLFSFNNKYLCIKEKYEK